MCRPDLSNRCSNSDDGQANANVGGDDSAINDDGMVVFVVVVTRTKTMIMKVVFSGTNVIMIYIGYHSVPHLVINHLKMDKCLLRQTNFMYFLAQL
jgi:hypothetical protein